MGTLYRITSSGMKAVEPVRFEPGKVYYYGAHIPASVIYVTRTDDDTIYYLKLIDHLYGSEPTHEWKESSAHLSLSVNSGVEIMTRQLAELGDHPMNLFHRASITRILAGDPAGFDLPTDYQTFDAWSIQCLKEQNERAAERAQMKHYTLIETANFIRAVLKKEFPGQKFSVRSDRFSMGSSIDVKWIDGPTQTEVNDLIKRFASKGVTDNTDYTPDVDGIGPDGQPCTYGASYVNGSRTYSADFLQRVAALECPKWGKTAADLNLVNCEDSEPYFAHEPAVIVDPHGHPFGRTLRDRVMTAVYETSDYHRPEPVTIESKPVSVDSQPMITSDRPTSRVGEYKGHPTITLIDGDKEFSFGLAKARQILANLTAIQAFVESQS